MTISSELVKLTLIGKSWKTHPEIFLKFSFSGSSHRPFYWKIHPLKIMSGPIGPLRTNFSNLDIFAVDDI